MQCKEIKSLISRVVGSTGFVIATTCGVGLSACGGDSTPAPVVVGTLTISPATPTVPATKTTKLTAEVKATNGQILTDRRVTWTSGSPTIAGVTDSGAVTGVAVGSALITATSEGKTATVSIKITQDPCEVSAALPIVANVVTTGSLTTLDCEVEDGYVVEAYNFVLPAATNVDILMKSTAIDSYLLVYRLEVVDTLSFMGDDDDSGGGNDARLTGTLTAGNYFILAANNKRGEFGAYTLLLTSPFSGINTAPSLFSPKPQEGVGVRRLNPGEARSLRGLVRRRRSLR